MWRAGRYPSVYGAGGPESDRWDGCPEEVQMTPFGYLVVFVSLVLALGVTRILTGIG